MGLFGKMFEKKNCDICGGEIVAGDILCTGEGGFIAPLAFPKDA